jgi:ketosteroid isomerase-like protein
VAQALAVNLDAWLAEYERAWREADADGVTALFTDDAVYCSSPFRDPHVGHDGIRAYWTNATATQEAVEIRFGEPVVDGARAAVEWWATLREGGEAVTLPGCLVLRFAPDGRCEELRESWVLERGRREPPPGWGR